RPSQRPPGRPAADHGPPEPRRGPAPSRRVPPRQAARGHVPPRHLPRQAPSRRGPARYGPPYGRPPRQRSAQAPRPRRRSGSIRRLNLTLLAVSVTLSLIIVRLVQLQGVDAATYRSLSQKWRMQTKPIPVARGQITSRDGTVLAMTVQTDLVIADPGDMR